MHQLATQESFSQPDSGYRFSQDPFLLASMVKESKEAGVLIDIGTGNGVLPLLLKKPLPNFRFIGIDIQHKPLVHAKQNFPQADFIQADAKEAGNLLNIPPADIVISNPPFWEVGSGRINKNREIALSRHEIKLSLAELIKTASHLLKDNGTFYLCHLPKRRDEIIKTLKENLLTPQCLRGVYSLEGKDEYLLLISARKNGTGRLKQLPPLTVFDQKRSYTNEVREIYERFER